MTQFCSKYKPECFADIKGQEQAIEKIQFFFKNFPKKKALILHGPAGTGKTSLAYVLAKETNSEILEINASDLRNKENLSRVIGEASKQESLTNKNKVLLVDEVDGISGYYDKGGMNELISLIEETNFPIVMTANDIWNKKFSELRKKAELVELKELSYRTISEILKKIAEKEKLELTPDILASVAVKARGDVRAAMNDLQSIDQETKHEDIGERDKEEKIFNVLRQVFKNMPNAEMLGLYDKTNMSLDEIFLWIEENIPLEYKGEELAKAFNALSLADVFRGRIHRQQHWRFLIYQNLLLSAGVSASKKNARTGFTMYKRPSRILKIWMINQKNKYKKSIAIKYARFCHVGVKRAMQEFFLIKNHINNEEMIRKLRLEEDEIEFLKS
ncbi:MAG: replication factor C large subunit [Candidatus Pacearchaeota archaeon]|nr:replication factor C large subunit [Candidatus Pacearchaeota archaeon]